MNAPFHLNELEFLIVQNKNLCHIEGYMNYSQVLMSSAWVL